MENDEQRRIIISIISKSLDEFEKSRGNKKIAKNEITLVLVDLAEQLKLISFDEYLDYQNQITKIILKGEF